MLVLESADRSEVGIEGDEDVEVEDVDVDIDVDEVECTLAGVALFVAPWRVSHLPEPIVSCVPGTAVNSPRFVFTPGRIAAELTLRRQTVLTQTNNITWNSRSCWDPLQLTLQMDTHA